MTALFCAELCTFPQSVTRLLTGMGGGKTRKTKRQTFNLCSKNKHNVVSLMEVSLQFLFFLFVLESHQIAKQAFLSQ
jgi:hypothetical protein